MWKAHQREIDDGLIALLPFQISTSFFTFLIPIPSVLVSQVFLYAILGWSFSSFLLQLQFSVIMLVASLQFGRASRVWLRGNNAATVKVYVAFFLYSLAFNGIFVSTNSVPRSIEWMFTLSTMFWGIGGSLMTLFDKPHYNNDDSCADMLSCLVADGNSTVRQLGYAPMCTSPRALVALVVATLVFFLLEYIGLWYHWSKVTLWRRLNTESKSRINDHSLGQSTNGVTAFSREGKTRHELDLNTADHSQDDKVPFEI
jgi:membrane protein CcdC involved in cytochrome C biogenesis